MSAFSKLSNPVEGVGPVRFLRKNRSWVPAFAGMTVLLFGAPACAQSEAMSGNAFCPGEERAGFELLPETTKDRDTYSQQLLDLARAEGYDVYLECAGVGNYLELASDSLWETARTDLLEYNSDSGEEVEQYISSHQNATFAAIMRMVAREFASSKIRNNLNSTLPSPDRRVRDFASTPKAYMILQELPKLTASDCGWFFQNSRESNCHKPIKLEKLGVYKSGPASDFFDHVLKTYKFSAAMFALGNSSGSIRYDHQMLEKLNLKNPYELRMQQFEKERQNNVH